MITPGQILENPVTGERFTFTDTAATTGGELLGFELGLRPQGAVPITHVHPIQSERFEVVEGRMRFRLGHRTIEAGPGDVVEVAPGLRHGFANAGDGDARVRVHRLVLISGRGEEEAQRSEEALRRSGAAWTIVRASFFDQNFSESFFREPLLEGELALPAAALTEDGHEGEVYEVTGPRLLTFAQAVEEIGRATGRELRYTTIGLDDFAVALGRDGVPAEEVGVLRYIFGEVLDGRNAHLADGVQRALGRPARDFADYARAAAASGAWDPAHARA